MKVIVEKASRKTKYVVPDDQEIIIGENSIQIGSMTICDLNRDTAEVVENVQIPEDWEGNKYCYLNGFVLADEFAVQEKKKALYAELEYLRTEMSNDILQARLNYDQEPARLTELMPFVRTMYQAAKTEIEALTEETVLTYKLRSPKYEQMLGILKGFL